MTLNFAPNTLDPRLAFPAPPPATFPAAPGQAPPPLNKTAAPPVPAQAPAPAPAPTPPRAYEPPEGPPENPPPTPPPNTPAPPPNQPAPPTPPPPDYEPHIAWLIQNVDNRISHDQWWQWINMGLYNPVTHKFRSENVDQNGNPIQGEFEKPVDCPEGTTKHGANTCLPLSDPRVGGGGGNPVEPSGPTPNGPNGSPQIPMNPSQFDAWLQNLLRLNLESPSRYTPEVLALLQGQLRSGTEGSVKRGQAGVRAEAARSGMSRAGHTQAALAAVRRGAESAELGQRVTIQTDKLRADKEDKLAALDRAQKYLDSLRDHLYRMDLTAIQKQQFQANLALAYANIQAQFDLLKARAGYDALAGSGREPVSPPGTYYPPANTSR